MSRSEFNKKIDKAKLKGRERIFQVLGKKARKSNNRFQIIRNFNIGEKEWEKLKGGDDDE